jgi:hypothetical protein
MTMNKQILNVNRQSEPVSSKKGEVYQVSNRPWFIARTLPGLLFQGWMILFFLATWLVVDRHILTDSGFFMRIPNTMAWVYGWEVLTVVAFFWIQQSLFDPEAKRIDALLAKEDKNDE